MLTEAQIAGLTEVLAGDEGVQLAYLFGSHARGDARAESDIDLAVLADREAVMGPADKGAFLRRLAGRLGTWVASERLDLVLLDDAPALLRHRVLAEGRMLFAATETARVRFVVKTLREHQDGEIRRRWFLRQRIRRLQRGDAHGGSGDLLAKARSLAPLLGKAEGFRGDD